MHATFGGSWGTASGTPAPSLYCVKLVLSCTVPVPAASIVQPSIQHLPPSASLPLQAPITMAPNMTPWPYLDLLHVQRPVAVHTVLARHLGRKHLLKPQRVVTRLRWRGTAIALQRNNIMRWGRAVRGDEGTHGELASRIRERNPEAKIVNNKTGCRWQVEGCSRQRHTTGAQHPCAPVTSPG